MIDPRFMRRAIALARRGRTSPNPMVGAVIVDKGSIVGEGYHHRAGEPHAEVFAIRRAGNRASGAALYVNLEPCCHQGATPPCTQAIIEAGIRTVVYGMVDPDPRVAGMGLEQLRRAGVRVEGPLCEEQARELNEAYIKHRTTGLPLVTLKLAMSLDGRIATRTGDSRWITGEKSRALVHRLRSRVDAVVVGAATARADNPRLTARLGSKEYYPTRVVVTRSGRIPADLRLFHEPGQVVVACSKSSDAEWLGKLEALGARILILKEQDGGLSVLDLLANLGKSGCLSVLIEGGGGLAAAALEERVVDKVLFFYGPLVIGGPDAVSSVAGIGAATIASAVRIADIRTGRSGDDLVVRGRVVYPE